MLFDLRGKVAVVTGATIGVGKGIALGLGEAGATVYVTGRRTEVNPDDWLPGSVNQVADEVTQLGGKGIGVRCDHTNDDEVEALFQRVTHEQGRLDILVNNIWGGYERMVEDGEFTWERPFWEQPLWRWNVMFDAGARAISLPAVWVCG
jgi:NAD(P)-dependent dehydrogenase (short-subunit alcohol dehydrogenase family)